MILNSTARSFGVQPAGHTPQVCWFVDLLMLGLGFHSCAVTVDQTTSIQHNFHTFTVLFQAKAFKDPLPR